MRVFVYWNLHKGQWSVRALEGPNKGRVIEHADSVCLSNARPRVSEAGRRRVLRERRKNVHAGVVGTLARAGDRIAAPLACPRVSYNPYKGPDFTYTGTTHTWHGSPWALLQDRGVWVTV